MDYSKFYTPPIIATALINELCISEPHKVIDICCGSCNLLLAAKKKWNKVLLYGVDLFQNSSVKNVTFEKNDGRKYAVDHSNEYELVLANPPFDSVNSKRQFPDLFVDEFKNITTSRLEIEMFIANLKLLQTGGVLLIIMPSSFVEAEKFRKIRAIIAEKYYIESIIKLDENTFGSSKINSYALIIHNELQQNRYTKTANVVDNRFYYKKRISSQRIRNGTWNNDTIYTSNIHLNIKRGNISSALFISRGQPVLHTSKYSNTWQPSIRYISKKANPTVWAEAGDIIVSRIGKSAGQWCIYNGEKTPISDCLYCIKSPDPLIVDKMKEKKYNKDLKGVATRYITISDFYSWLNSL